MFFLDVCKRVLIFIQIEDWRLIFELCVDVSFCDVEWLRVGSIDSDLIIVELMVYKSILIDIVQFLGIFFLSRKLVVIEMLGF